MKLDPEDFRLIPGKKVDLSTIPTTLDFGLSKSQAKQEYEKLGKEFRKLQQLLYAEGKKALLIILQAMDAGGKDSTVREVFSPLNPQGCKVIAFKSPNSVELCHDFLWRIHQNTPRHGHIGVFNRSHYEDVLIVNVKNLAPKELWSKRYDHINNFEKMLNDEGTIVRKFFLHISKDYQKTRLQRRLKRPDKQWKFEPADLEDRKDWEKYQTAYETIFQRCNTDACPWYVVPAENRRYRDLVILKTLVQTLQNQNMKFPPVKYDLSKVVIE